MTYLRIMMRKLCKRTWIRHGVLFLVVYALISSILILKLVPEAVVLEIGQASPKYIGAPRMVEDRFTTTVLKTEASNAVAEVYEQDPTTLGQVLKEAREIFAVFRVAAADVELNEQLRIEFVRKEIRYELSDVVVRTGLTIDEPLEEQMVGELTLALEPVYRLGIKLDGLDNARKTVSSTLSTSSLKAQYRVLLTDIARSAMRANMRLNEASTQKLKQEAASRVQPVIVQKGQKIIGLGEIATEREIHVLQDLGLLRTSIDWKIVSGSLLYALLVLLLPTLYIFFVGEKLQKDSRSIVITGVIFMLGAVLTYGASLLSGYLIPVAAVSILLTVLIEPKLALVAGFSLAMLSAGLVGFEVRFVVVALLGTAASVYAVSQNEHRGSLVRGGIIVGAVNALAILAFTLLFGGSGSDFLRDALLGFGGGVISSVFAIGSLPFLENTFGVTSTIKLSELANPHQELLKRLLVEAPGTYHHSIIVANLAEAAAEQVGADALRARVGAYYHDVGKIERPYFFIENQTMMENPHNDYPPHLSSLIITSHAKDGVKLAKEYKVPETIIDIIREHHGTSLVQYFYSKAQEINPDAREEDFVYEGPRPRTRESAIVMLADIVEAAVRSINSPTPAKIEKKVRDLIREKLFTGQLDESDLTLRDLDIIGTAFVRHLSGIFHHRIEYPERGGKLNHAGVMEQRPGKTEFAGGPGTTNP